MNLDYWLFFKFYNLSGHSQIVDSLILFLGQYFFYLILAVFALCAYRDYKKGGFAFLKPYGLAVFSSLVARFGIAELIRLFYHRPRPFMALALPHLLTDSSYSFPSGHTIFIFALATSAYFFNRKLGCFLYFSGLLIGLARISGGAHYPSDILGGMILGTLTSLIIFYLSKRKKLGTVPIFRG